jgi:shikimate dehydrogenase
LSTLAGVLGFPVRHSRSPAMMNAAFAELGLDWLYLHLPVPPELFAETVRALPGSGYRGANVTIPHKLAAHELADELTDAAAAIGAVNTLSFEDSGRITGDNTDAGGLLDALGQERPASALVLGAGGAARAAVWALREVGAEVTIWNRTPQRARDVAGEFGVDWTERPAAAAELLVNATSIGLAKGDSPDALPLVDAGTVVDLVYGREPTELVQWAERRGARVIDGLDILVRQGARSLERWSGRPAPLDTMRRAVSSPVSSTSARS